MSFFKSLANLFRGGPSSGASGDVYWIYARCNRCREVLAARINLANDLSVEYDEDDRPSGYHVRKLLTGTGARRCYQQVEVEVEFNARKEVVSQTAHGGTIITREEYEAEHT